MGSSVSTEMAEHFDLLATSEWYRKDRSAQNKRIDKFFELLDTDQSGDIDGKEIKVLVNGIAKAFKKVTGCELDKAKVRKILDKFDANGDAAFDPAEFRRFMYKIQDLIVKESLKKNGK